LVPRILFVTVDLAAGAVFAVTVERFAQVIAARSVHEGSFELIIIDQGREEEVRSLAQGAKARGGALLVIAQPITVRSLIERARGALAVNGCPTQELPRLGRRVSQAVEQVRLNYHGALTVGTLADAIHVSPSHLAHRFSAEIGISVKDYVTKVRIELVRRLLLETDAKLESIADAVGFCDAPHLSRVFVQHTRRRPGEYRRRPGVQQLSTRTAQERPLNSV
jgi:AraC-like DNA-binding protein